MNFIFNIAYSNILKYKYFALLFVVFEFCSEANALANKAITNHNTLLIINHSPVFNKSSYSYNVSEDAGLGNFAGAVSATDRDGDQLTYTIKSGNTNNTWAIDSKNGSIIIAKYLNHHTQDRYTLVVRVADPGGLWNEASVIITVQAGTTIPDFTNITWGTSTAQPYGTHEIDGGVVNGNLYIFGGFDVLKRPNYTPTKRAFAYDPITEKWTSIADLPHLPNGAGFGGISNEGLATDGTDFYFAGGYPSNSSGTGQVFGTKQVWKYNVVSNTYTSLPNLPIELAAGQLRYLKGKLHYMGGANKSRRDTSVHYALNLDSLSAGWKVLAPLLNATNKAGSAVYEGKIYYISGSHFQNARAIPQKTVQVYDPTNNTWTKVADIPIPRDHITSSVIVIGDRILVEGGYTSSSSKCNLVSAYSPSGDEWENLTPLPASIGAGVAGMLNDNIYYSGGIFTKSNYKGVPIGISPIQKIDSFTLINADTDQPLQTINSGDTLNLATLPTTHLNIQANCNLLKAGSVQFELAGSQNQNIIDNQAPYALFGDNGSGDYFAWTPPLGNYTLKGTPFSAPGATGTAGISETIIFTVINDTTPQAVILSPTADAFVRDGIYANTNYGDSALNVKTAPTSKFTRYSYLKFSLEGISNISSATLRLYGSNITDTSTVSLSAYGVDDDSWTENGIVFSNAPAPLISSLSSTAVTNVARYYEFDVTDFVKKQFTGDKTVSLLVKDPKISDKDFVFNSRENSQNLPQLIIETGAQNKEPKPNSNRVSSSISLAGKSANNLAPLLLESLINTKVYPNPIHKTFTVEFAKDCKGIYDLQIVDPAGRIYELGKSQLKKGMYNIEVDVSKLSLKGGVYFLRIQSDTKQTETIKLIAEQ